MKIINFPIITTIFLNLIAANAVAGTIITANLPPNVAIVNINGREDGADLLNQALWRSPFNTTGPGNLLRYAIQAGTYRLRVINPADAAALFPALTSTQTNQIYQSWTYNSPWITDYLVFDSAATNNNSIYQLFDGAFTANSYGGPAAGYQGALNEGREALLRVGPAGRGSTNYVTAYTFTNQTLIFVVPDNILSDNAGGVSVLIIPAVSLSISATADTAMVRWPTNNSTSLTLVQKTNLTDPIWTTVTPPPTVVGSNYSASLPLLPHQFFQLR